MRSRNSTEAWPGIVALVGCVALQVGCGSRGAPLPPVYPNPPPIASLSVAQRGAFAVLRFPVPPAAAVVGDEDLEVQAVEILVYAERYPVVTTDMLVDGLARRAEVMRADAAADEADAAAAAAALAEATAANPDADPLTLQREAAFTSTRPSRTADEDLLHRVPPALLESWRVSGLPGDSLVEAAQRFNDAVDTLWTRLGLPGLVLNPQEDILLPDAGTIAVESTAVLQPTVFERPLAAGVFLNRAAVSRSIPYEQLEELLVGEMVQVVLPLGAPAPGDLRTRYFFAVRAKSDRETPGTVNVVVPLAPATVPVAPGAARTTLDSAGVVVSWEAPSGDLSLRRIDPASLQYNVYRSLPGEVALPDPLNSAPIAALSFTDRSMTWGETYVYEVRAMVPQGGTLRRESEGAVTAEVTPLDIFPPAPPSTLQIARAGSQVTLQWSPSASIDLVGYRVYRHAVPAPPAPPRYDPGADPAIPDQPPAPAAGEQRVDDDDTNPMIEAGWELISESLVQFGNYTDRNPQPGVRYAYAIEAVDREFNVSALLVGEESENVDR